MAERFQWHQSSTHQGLSRACQYSPQNSCAKHIAFAKTFLTKHQPVPSLHPGVEAYFQLDLGRPSLQAPCAVLLEDTF